MRTQRTQENITGKKKTSRKWLCPASSSPIPILYPRVPAAPSLLFIPPDSFPLCVCAGTQRYGVGGLAKS